MDPPGSVIALLSNVVPSVVAIHTLRVIPRSNGESSQSPKIERAEGSGFIISADGYIATNKHVVHDAYSVTVILSNGQALEADVVHESPVIDVAFLRVKAGRSLPAVTLASNDALKIGQRVVAVGNPEGLGISASAGIVSALDRNLKTSPYDRYIQTDAAINPGNSGGPLFDLAGQVVGMNSISWVVGESAGSIGLGFAIPGSSISFLMDQFRRNGRIDCGTLGIKGQRLTASMRNALGFDGESGVIVTTVDGGSAAAQAGLRVGDVIERFDDKQLDDITMLQHLACFALGRSALVDVWRDGRTAHVKIALVKAEDITGVSQNRAMLMPPRFASARDLGMTLALIDGEMRQRYKLGSDVTGFVVTAVADSSEAQVSGLSTGDVIKSLNMKSLSADATFDAMFTRTGAPDRHYVIALVETKGVDRWVTLPNRIGSM